MSGVVLRETARITDAILDSDPQYQIALACRQEIRGSHLFHKDIPEPGDKMYGQIGSGFAGGDLYNVVTAAFFHMRMSPYTPLTAHKLPNNLEPGSFIGSLAVSIINQSHEDPSDLAINTDLITRNHKARLTHICNEAERGFKRDAMGKGISWKGMRPEVHQNNDGETILYRKYNGQPSAIVLARNGCRVNGIWVPPGTIGYLLDGLADTSHRAYGMETPLVRRLTAMTRFLPGRILASGVPKDERQETFTTPVGMEEHGLDPNNLNRFYDMNYMRRKLSVSTHAELATM